MNGGVFAPTPFLISIFLVGRWLGRRRQGRRGRRGRAGGRLLGEQRATFAATGHRLSVVCLCEADSD